MGRSKLGIISKIKRAFSKTVGIAGKVGGNAMQTEEKIPKKLKIVFLIIIVFGSIVAAAIFLQDKNMGILAPKGIIASKQRHLLYITALLSLIVVIPVFVMTFFIAFKYRESNKSAKYTPDDDHSKAAEITWWAIPVILIFILSIITWQSTHELDPFKSLESDKKPLKIQVIALDWKWLFIYPDQHIATINYVQIPVNTPVDFDITSDAPMNSFWVPQLGGQVYAMSGMSTQLHLSAVSEGDYAGSSSNISGKGFAGMKFTVHASTLSDFIGWSINTADKSPQLNMSTYNELAKPSQNSRVAFYRLEDPAVYDNVIMKYNAQGSDMANMMMGSH